MHDTVSLNDLYADFSAGLLEKREFEGAVCRAIGNERLPGLERDDHEDYISWLYPRITRAITNYRETGSSFEAYIGALVRLTVKEYQLRQARSCAADFTTWITQIPDLYAGEDEPQYGEDSGDTSAVATVQAKRLKNPRQLLILLLKCSSYVSADFLERVSPRLGMEPKALGEMISRLREQRAKREGDISLLQERANCQFFRCIFYERILQTMPRGSIATQRLRERLERGRGRLVKMRRRLARLRPDPSNSQIAEVLGIAKGTVDATLFNLRARWNIECDNNILN